VKLHMPPEIHGLQIPSMTFPPVLPETHMPSVLGDIQIDLRSE